MFRRFRTRCSSVCCLCVLLESVCLSDTPIVLDVQYRCHPVIANLASSLFYGNKLRHGENTTSILRAIPSLPPVVFVHNVSPETPRGGSPVVSSSFKIRSIMWGKKRLSCVCFVLFDPVLPMSPVDLLG